MKKTFWNIVMFILAGILLFVFYATTARAAEVIPPKSIDQQLKSYIEKQYTTSKGFTLEQLETIKRWHEKNKIPYYNEAGAVFGALYGGLVFGSIAGNANAAALAAGAAAAPVCGPCAVGVGMVVGSVTGYFAARGIQDWAEEMDVNDSIDTIKKRAEKQAAEMAITPSPTKNHSANKSKADLEWETAAKKELEAYQANAKKNPSESDKLYAEAMKSYEKWFNGYIESLEKKGYKFANKTPEGYKVDHNY